jgi:hypothetical protein
VNYRNRDLLDLAYQLDCTARIPGVCQGGMGEPMHSNQSRHGQGTALKSHDVFFASGCRACHAALDHGHPSLSGADRLNYWQIAFERTLLALFAGGHLTVATKLERPADATAERRPPPKARIPSRPFSTRPPAQKPEREPYVRSTKLYPRSDKFCS